MTQKQREPHRQDLVEAQRSGCNHLLPGPPDQSLMILPVGNREIAQQLDIGEQTVKTHVSHVLGKLDVPSRTHAALYAIRIGLVLSG